MLDLPNEGDHVYLTALDHMPAYGKVRNLFSYLVNGRKPKTTTELKSRLLTHSKWFIGNVISRGGYNDFVHPLHIYFFIPSSPTGKATSIMLFLSLLMRHTSLFLVQTLLP